MNEDTEKELAKRRCVELFNAESSQYWSIERDQTALIERSGDIDTKGVSRLTKCATEEVAVERMVDLILLSLDEGFSEEKPRRPRGKRKKQTRALYGIDWDAANWSTLAAWRKLKRRLRVVVDNGETAADPPTDANLNQFEKEAGIKLPRSYRKYIQVFGSGAFGLDSIRAPNTRHKREFCIYDAEGDLAFEYIDEDCAKLLGGLLTFGRNWSAGNYCWDPRDVRHNKFLEYGIYYKDDNDPSLISEVAGTFPEFVYEVLIMQARLDDNDDADVFSPEVK